MRDLRILVVETCGELKRTNYGSNGNAWVCIWNNSICSSRKTNKDLKRKRNPRRELQRRVMHPKKSNIVFDEVTYREYGL